MSKNTINIFKSGSFIKASICLLIIASLLICLACNLSKSNRFYLATPTNTPIVSSEQYLASSTSFHVDFAGEETLRSASSSYSNFNYSLVRSQRSACQSYILLFTFLLASIFVFSNNLSSYGYEILLKQNFASVCIAKYIEHSDGKK